MAELNPRLFRPRLAKPSISNHARRQRQQYIFLVLPVLFTGAFLAAFLSGRFWVGSPYSAQAANLRDGLYPNTPSLTVTAPSNVSIPQLDSGGSARTVNTSITVSTTAPQGYSMTLAMRDGTGNCLRSQTINSSDQCSAINHRFRINPIPVDNATALSLDTWGVSLNSGTNWRILPLQNIATLVLRNTPTAITDQVTNLTFGARAGNDLVGGAYSAVLRAAVSTNTINSATITSISTNNPGGSLTAGLSGGDILTISGTNFVGAYEVAIGSTIITASNCNVVTAGQITCTLPVMTAGSRSVTVRTWGSTAGVTSSQQIAYTASPTPTGLTVSLASGGAAPTNNIFNAGTTAVFLRATSPIYATCAWGNSATDTPGVMTPSPANVNTSHTTPTATVSGLQNGTSYTRYVRCTYPNSPAGTAVAVTFHVRATTPTVALSLSPTPTSDTTNRIYNAGTTSVTVNATVTPNVAATCVIGTAANPTTPNMATTGNTTHTQAITTANGTSYTRHVRCRTGTGNTQSDWSADQSITFHVRTATPTLSSTTPANNVTLAFGTTSTTVSATTSPASTCTYSLVSQTGSTGTAPTVNSSTGAVANLNNGISITWRSSCIVGSGNTQSEVLVTDRVFTVASCPSSTPVCGTGGDAPACAANGAIMQTITLATTPTTRIWVRDARDNRTYWIRRINDTRGADVNGCAGDLVWMETNLAYAGGGTTTYGDTTTLTVRNAGAGAWNVAPVNGTPYVRTDNTAGTFISPLGPLFTTNPTPPSTSIEGTAAQGGTAGVQRGFLYNWCAAMGGPTGNATACNNTSSTQTMAQGPNTGAGANNNVNVCPRGWRLPRTHALGTTGSAANNTNTNEFWNLNQQVNSGSTTTDSDLRTNWLGVRAGDVANSGNLLNVGTLGYYWSSTVNSATGARNLYFSAPDVYPTNNLNKTFGLAVRCVLG